MIVPFDQIPSETLNALIESFIMREGTDYGEYEVSHETKIHQIKDQLKQGAILIVYDAATESVNIMTKQRYEEWL